MDLFEKWLKKNESPNVKRALTAASYKQIDHQLTDKDVADDLATYGDALIRCYYVYKFMDKCEKLSQEVEKYITDERWVKVIAKHYDLIEFMKFDRSDKKIPQNYEYKKPCKKNKTSPHKYIATAVEAMIAAIYLDAEDNEKKEIGTLLEDWLNLN